MSLNKVFLVGNLTRDAELVQTAGGTSILKFGIAVNERRKNQQTGTWEDFPQFFDLSIFGRRAEALAQYLTKGLKVAVEGKLHYSSWEDKNGGGKRSKIDVTVDEIELMSSRDGQQGGRQQQRQSQPYSDEDMPF